LFRHFSALLLIRFTAVIPNPACYNHVYLLYSRNKTDDVQVDDGTYSLRNLLDNKMYHVIVCARNSAGCGQPSPVITFTTLQALPGEQ